MGLAFSVTSNEEEEQTMGRFKRAMNITNAQSTMTGGPGRPGPQTMTMDLGPETTTTSTTTTTTTTTTPAPTTTTTTTLPPTTESTTMFVPPAAPNVAAFTTAAMSTTAIMPVSTTVVNTVMGLSMSNTILIAVFTGCTALILLVLTAICCRLMPRKDGHDGLKGGSGAGSTNPYADPYRLNENHYQSSDVTRLYAAPSELTYAKPEIYSTFMNPAFYEDVYARWKNEQTQQKIYDTTGTWQFSRQAGMPENPELYWSNSQIKAMEAYDYDKYGKIPRPSSQVCDGPMEKEKGGPPNGTEAEAAPPTPSTAPVDPPAFTTF